MKKVIIVIPVYKAALSEKEEKSLLQCFRILYKYPISFFMLDALHAEYYKQLAEKNNIEYQEERFHAKYFASLDGYNRLMLTKEFYERYASYEYMLIYQPDAYVFSDELLYWCSQNYDFIGAPSVGEHYDTVFSNKLVVGNGGFSLRKINTFIQAFDCKKNLFPVKEIINRYAVFKKPWTRIPLLLLMIFGFRNKFSYIAANWKYPEDDFWSKYLCRTNWPLSKPEPETAVKFAFERFPSSLYEINGQKLPFGCHGWYRYEYEEFWKKFIE